MPVGDWPNVLFCPISSFPYLVARNKIPCLRHSCVFDLDVKPGWINYNPNKVTVLSCNEMFRPIYETPPFYSTEKQTIKVKTVEDCKALEELFEKPVILVVSRRQEDEEMVLGFDTDFVVLFNPADPKVADEFKKITDYAVSKIELGKNFFLTFDLSEAFEAMTPHHFKGHVMWLNTCFHVTNYCRPSLILFLDVAWCFMCPCYVFVSLPYRLWRNIRSEDITMAPKIRLNLKVSFFLPLILHFYQAEQPLPGRYRKYYRHNLTGLRSASELWCLIQLRGPPSEETDA